jgi:hypothetical protein
MELMAVLPAPLGYRHFGSREVTSRADSSLGFQASELVYEPHLPRMNILSRSARLISNQVGLP